MATSQLPTVVNVKVKFCSTSMKMVESSEFKVYLADCFSCSIVIGLLLNSINLAHHSKTIVGNKSGKFYW